MRNAPYSNNNAYIPSRRIESNNIFLDTIEKNVIEWVSVLIDKHPELKESLMERLSPGGGESRLAHEQGWKLNSSRGPLTTALLDWRCEFSTGGGVCGAPPSSNVRETGGGGGAVTTRGGRGRTERRGARLAGGRQPPANRVPRRCHPQRCRETTGSVSIECGGASLKWACRGELTKRGASRQDRLVVHDRHGPSHGVISTLDASASTISSLYTHHQIKRFACELNLKAARISTEDFSGCDIIDAERRRKLWRHYM